MAKTITQSETFNLLNEKELIAANKRKAQGWYVDNKTFESPEAVTYYSDAMKIEDVKEGDYFRFNSTTVYVKNGYDRSSKKYCAYKFDDVNHHRQFKKGTLVQTSFEF